MSFLLKKFKVNSTLMRFIFARRQQLLTCFFVIGLVLSFASYSFAQSELEEEDPVMLFNQGQDAHEKGDLKAALKFYDEAIKLAPEFPEAEYQRGNVLNSLGKSAEAEKAFRRALELRENWNLPLTALGVILVDTNNFAEAEKVLTKAIESDAQNFPAFSALTDLRIRSKADPKVLKELLTKLQTLTSTTKPPASIWIARADLENALNDKVATKTSLSRAILIEPLNKSALMRRADIAIAEADSATATEIAANLVKIVPDSAELKILRAKILTIEGKSPEALKILDSIANPPSEAMTLREQIIARSSVNVADLEKHLEKNPKDVISLGRLCVLLRKENPAKALEYCRRASAADPENINHAIGFGAALVQFKKFEEAVSLFRKVIQIAPDNYAAHTNLATALFELKRFEEAKTEYFWVAKNRPELAITYFFIAISHDNLGQYIDALANYQKFLKLADPTQNQLEIEKVELRLPNLERQIKNKK